MSRPGALQARAAFRDPRMIASPQKKDRAASRGNVVVPVSFRSSSAELASVQEFFNGSGSGSGSGRDDRGMIGA